MTKRKSMTYNKITVGYVVQRYEDGIPVSQDFIAGGEVSYETLDGTPIEPEFPETGEAYLPFGMIQPVVEIP